VNPFMSACLLACALNSSHRIRIFNVLYPLASHLTNLKGSPRQVTVACSEE